jgi:hypothetical protein
MSKASTYYAGQLYGYITYEYSASGLRSKESYYNASDELGMFHTIEYNAFGLMSRLSTYDDGQLQSYTTFEYNASGLRSKDSSYNASGQLLGYTVYEYSEETTVATPVCSPVPGSYTAAQSVTLSCATPGATIRYTTDNTEPNASSAVYTSSIGVSTSTTIKAKAFKSGLTASATATGSYIINAPETMTLGEALDAPQLTWSSGGAAPWTGQTVVTHDGVGAAQSGVISDNQETLVETSVVGPVSLSFWWKVSSESGYDFLEFCTNSVCVTRIAGEVNWQAWNGTLGTGTQVLRWRYMKDGSVSSGLDRSWVDQVSFTPASGRPVILVNDGSFGVRTNSFGFNLSGTAGQFVIVEGSTNLLNWLSLQTNILGSEPLYFSDPATGAFPCRFYRARVAPQF